MQRANSRAPIGSLIGVLVGVLVGALVLAACTASGKPAPATLGTSGSPASPSAAMGSIAPADAPAIGDLGASDLLVARRDGGAADRGLAVVDGGPLKELFSLPLGVATADWHTIYAVEAAGATTTVKAVDPNGGTTRTTIKVPGAWRLPTIGVGRAPAGLSGDGGTLVLEEATSAGAGGAGGNASSQPGRTAFAVIATDGSTKPRTISLPGALDYDALSSDGASLYVIEHRPGGDPTQYAVRRVDLATGRLVDGDIVDKSEGGEAMTGYAVTQLITRGTFVYTVYRGHGGAFIHALDTSLGIAFCIDLPGSSGEDATTAAAWGVALDPGGKTLYAANGALGTVSKVDLASFSVVGTATLARLGVIELAKFGHATPVVGGQVALGPDGTALYVVGDRGIAVVRTADLGSAGRIDGARSYRALAIGASGALYGIDAGGALVRLDPASGHVTATDPLDRFSGIVAVAPGG